MADSGTFRSLTLAVVGALGSAIGGLGFVTFVGGAILLARFRGDGIPGVGALAKLSKNDAAVVGADQLLDLIVIPLIAAIVLGAGYHLLSRCPAPVSGLRFVILILAGSGALIAFAIHADPWLSGEGNQRLLFVTAVLVLVLGLGGAAVRAEWRLRQATSAPTLERDTDGSYRVVRDGRTIVAALANAEAAGRAALDAAQSVTRRRWSLGFISIVFVAGAVFAAIEKYTFSLNHPEGRAFAIARSGSPPIAGLFVAEDSSFVYLARVRQRPCDHNRGVSTYGRILAVPRSNVLQEAVGHFEPLPKAIKLEPTMLTQVAGPTRAATAQRDEPPGPCKG